MTGPRVERRGLEVGNSTAGHSRWSWRAAVIALCASGALVGAAMALHVWKDVPIADLTRDPVTTFQAAPYVGLLSQSGILVWAGAAAVCLFGASVAPGSVRSSGARQFLLVSGLATLFLGLDAAFLFHEEFAPRLGVPQALVFVVYAALLALYVWRFAAIIRDTEYALLAVSLAVDVGHPEVLGRYALLAEDGAKLMGTAFWLVYFARTAATIVRGHLAREDGARSEATGSPGASLDLR